ncbi:zinc finger protein 1 homolog [Malaya genurostris]|uniref:zinc finger protein 1 homolog n=1 Tax=Malaya genurostris TaxID=325434 RepID=UPI0026F3B19F|nr:zinc finger protein 1 homolog [Malaya genurostris]
MSNVAEICRICRKLDTETVAFVSLFSYHELENRSLASMLETIAGISADPNDANMPRQVCSDCSKQLKISYDFYRLCIESDKFLRNVNAGKVTILESAKYERSEEQNSQLVAGPSIRSGSVYLSDYDASFYQVILDRFYYTVLIFVAHRCCGCRQAFCSDEELHVHSQHVHKANDTILRPNQCEVCYMCFPYADALEYHRQSVQGHLFCCRECLLLFDKKHALFSHLRQHHHRPESELEKEFHCMGDGMAGHSIFDPEPNLVVSNVQSLAGTDATFDPYDLGYCEITSDLKINQLKPSQYKVSERGDNFSIIEFTWHRCCACNHMFSRQTELDIHCTEEHRKPYGSTQVESKPFICWQCWRRFKRKSLLSLHQKFNRKKIYACNTCLGIFFGRPVFEKHIPKCTVKVESVIGAVKPVHLSAADEFAVSDTHLGDVKEEPENEDVYILND